MVKGMGGAMDLVAGVKKVIVLMDHNSKKMGTQKSLISVALPLTGKVVVNKIITNLGVFEINEGIKLLELADNVSREEVLEKTGAEVIFAS